MGMEVRKEESEEGKLVDLTMRHHASGVPVPPLRVDGQTLALNDMAIDSHEAAQHVGQTGDVALNGSHLPQFLQAA